MITHTLIQSYTQNFVHSSPHFPILTFDIMLTTCAIVDDFKFKFGKEVSRLIESSNYRDQKGKTIMTHEGLNPYLATFYLSFIFFFLIFFVFFIDWVYVFVYVKVCVFDCVYVFVIVRVHVFLPSCIYHRVWVCVRCPASECVCVTSYVFVCVCRRVSVYVSS